MTTAEMLWWDAHKNTVWKWVWRGLLFPCLLVVGLIVGAVAFSPMSVAEYEEMFDDPEVGVKILEKNAAAHERLALEYGIDMDKEAFRWLLQVRGYDEPLEIFALQGWLFSTVSVADEADALRGPT